MQIAPSKIMSSYTLHQTLALNFSQPNFCKKNIFKKFESIFNTFFFFILPIAFPCIFFVKKWITSTIRRFTEATTWRVFSRFASYFEKAKIINHCGPKNIRKCSHSYSKGGFWRQNFQNNEFYAGTPKYLVRKTI